MIGRAKIHNSLRDFVVAVIANRQEIENQQTTNNQARFVRSISNRQLFEILLDSKSDETKGFGFIAPLAGVRKYEIGLPQRLLSEEFMNRFVESVRSRVSHDLAEKVRTRIQLPFIDIQHSAAVLAINQATGRNHRTAKRTIKRDRYFVDYDAAIQFRFFTRVSPAWYEIDWSLAGIAESSLI